MNYRVKIPPVKTINPVGSGDSVLAGFTEGIYRNLFGQELIKFGLAMGVLNAMEYTTNYINLTNLNWCLKEIEVEKIM
ncbi:PfkB family carbohydrate kinase [Evansella vedderi]|uniref:PfkB family carbohydrate kinase n=1 Tax=Evansella vedderi TaxID=38282 RepID=UPI003520AE5C